MVAKFAILFAGFIVAAVALNLYYLVICFFTIFLLGIENELFHSFVYWLCFVLGVATTWYVLRNSWPKSTLSADNESVDAEAESNKA